MALDRAQLLTALRSVAQADTPSPKKVKRNDKSPASMFACGGKIDASQYILPCSLFVQGLGELPLPISASNISRLIGLSEQAPYGKGHATVIDSNVRKARQVDASLLANDPQNSPFFLETIQGIAADATARMGIDVHSIHLDAKLYKLLLYEAGGHFTYHRDTEREHGMFGTLIIQLPTESPHQGGQLVVRHAKSSITFDFSGSKSSRKFYYTAFFADCKHKLNMITKGSRVCLVFNLVRQSVVHAQKPSCNISEACIASTAAALKPWLEGWDEKEQPRKLFIPLEHKYTKANLCFAGLKGRDSLVAGLLQAYNRNACLEESLEVHLCIFTKHSVDQEDGDVETDFKTDKWVGIDDKDVGLSKIGVDVSSEVLEKEEDLFPSNLEPDEKEHEGHMGNYGPTDQYWYHLATLVIWPKRKTALIACSEDLMGAVDILCSKLNQRANAEAQALFKDLLEFWLNQRGSHSRKRPCHMGFHSQATDREAQCKANSRLLEFCSQIGDFEDMCKVIDILAGSESELRVEQILQDSYMFDHQKQNGIASDDVAKMLALAVEKHGWDACGKLVLEKLMLGSRIRNECQYYAKLALEFHEIGMHDAAVCIAARAHALVCNSNIELPVPGVGAVMVMLFTLQECHESLAPNFVDYIIRQAKPLTLCTLIVKLKGAGSNDVCADASTKMLFCLKSSPHLLGLFTKLCNALTSCELIVPAKPKCVYRLGGRKQSETIKDHIVGVMEAYMWLDNSSSLEDMVKSIVSNAQTSCSQELLREIINSSSFWQKASASETGRKALTMLVKERIRMLSSKSKPVFSWCQPSAVLPQHANVEAFLRGPLEKFTYNGPFTGLSHARNFARKYFGTYGSSQQSGYSATATEGGRGKAAYCTIVKTRGVFEDMKKQWKAWQEELARLRKSVEGIHIIQEEENAEEGEEQNAGTLSGEVQEEGRRLFEVKRLKTSPAGKEVIDLT